MRREGPLTGGRVELLALSDPIARDGAAAPLTAARDVPPRAVLGCRVMRRLRLVTIAVLAGLIGSAPSVAAADEPTPGALYADGHDGRYLLGGPWLFRPDPGDGGEGAGWFRETATAGWAETTVPRAWNLGDDSPASMLGGVGWYRKDFTLPSRGGGAAVGGPLRVGQLHARKVWLNGRAVGSHRGAYLPFEFVLDGLNRTRHEPPRGARRLAPGAGRLPARGPQPGGRARRRLVELQRDPARGLPAPGATRPTSGR